MVQTGLGPSYDRPFLKPHNEGVAAAAGLVLQSAGGNTPQPLVRCCCRDGVKLYWVSWSFQD